MRPTNDLINAGPHRPRRYVPQGGAETPQRRTETAPGAPSTPDVDTDTDDTVSVPEDAITVDSLLQWVNDTSDDDVKRARAQTVLDAENARDGGPRSTLVGSLEDMITAPSDTD